MFARRPPRPEFHGERTAATLIIGRVITSVYRLAISRGIAESARSARFDIAFIYVLRFHFSLRNIYAARARARA